MLMQAALVTAVTAVASLVILAYMLLLILQALQPACINTVLHIIIQCPPYILVLQAGMRFHPV